MKDLKVVGQGYGLKIVEPDGELYGYPDYDYLIASFEHEVLVKEDIGYYQGDTFVLFKDHADAGVRYGFLEIGWGSCSGCDALQACETPKELINLRDSLYSEILWGDVNELWEDLHHKVDSNSWWSSDNESLRALQRIIARLEAEQDAPELLQLKED